MSDPNIQPSDLVDTDPVSEPQTDGVADHLAKPKGFKAWVTNARKAVVAFLASGILAGFGDSLAHFDFTNLSWGNLWTGLLGGLIASTLVYIVRNQGFIKVDPALEKTVEQIINDRLKPTNKGVIQ